MNSTKRFLSLVLTLAVLVGTLVLTTNASDSIKSAIGIVDASGLRLREGPGTDTEILTTATATTMWSFWKPRATGIKLFTTCGKVICTAIISL